jgi:hypothetical protein
MLMAKRIGLAQPPAAAISKRDYVHDPIERADLIVSRPHRWAVRVLAMALDPTIRLQRPPVFT